MNTFSFDGAVLLKSESVSFPAGVNLLNPSSLHHQPAAPRLRIELHCLHLVSASACEGQPMVLGLRGIVEVLS